MAEPRRIRRVSDLRSLVLTVLLTVGGVCGAGQVDRRTAGRAEQIVFGIDYLPFRQLENGCNSRAIYMGLELADAGIPAVQQYARGTSPFALFPRPGQAWDYHTAPLIWVRGDSEPLVLDPSLADRPLERRHWVERLNARSSVSLFWSDIGNLGIGDQTSETEGPSHPRGLPASVSELVGFRGGDLMFVSREMCAYLDGEPGVAPEVTLRKKKKLEERTRQLLRSLDQKGLVRDYEVSGIADFGC